jgi:hypothetical protein
MACVHCPLCQQDLAFKTILALGDHAISHLPFVGTTVVARSSPQYWRSSANAAKVNHYGLLCFCGGVGASLSKTGLARSFASHLLKESELHLEQYLLWQLGEWVCPEIQDTF